MLHYSLYMYFQIFGANTPFSIIFQMYGISNASKVLNTHLNLASFYRTPTNSAEPDQTPQNAASDQVQHCLLTEYTFKI